MATTSQPPLSTAARVAGEAVWEVMWEHACQHHVQQQGRRMIHNLDEPGRQRLRVWQATCCCIPFAPVADILPLIQSIFDMLKMELLATVKAMKEIMLVFLFKQQPRLIWTFLLPRLSDYSQSVSRVDSLPSAILVAAQLLFDAAPEEQEALLRPVLTAILPWSLLHHQSIRAYSQVIMQAILQRFPQVLSKDASSELLAIASFLQLSPSMRKLQGLKSIALKEMEADTARKPSQVFDQLQMGSTGAGGGEAIFAREASPASLLEVVQDFLIDERANLRSLAQREIQHSSLAANDGGESEGHARQADLQRKIQPLQHALEAVCSSAYEETFMESLPPESASALAQAQDTGSRQSIIMVASLLDRVPNLAGLTRTCEVFKAQALVLADLSVIKQREFAGISVTAEKHMPLLEVKSDELQSWLNDKKKEGYVVLGLEQTSEAVPLPQYNFPKKAVMLLGREREGIPPNLLSLLDQALVIPQLGVIRSLNAHVSGSIALYEYTRHFLQ